MTNKQMDFKAYSFPDISFDSILNKTENTVGYNGFERLDFNDNRKKNHDLLKNDEQSKQEEKDKEAIEKAFKIGYSEGKKEGERYQKDKVSQALNSLHSVLSELDKIKKEIHLTAEHELITLSLAIARKILVNEISDRNNKTVLKVVEEALNRVVSHDKIKIRVNPSEIDMIKDAMPQFLHLVDNIEAVTIEEDKAISKGGCMVETNLGNIDARIESRLQVIEEIFDSELQISRNLEPVIES
ncbi:MAG: hypothetical protein J7L16_00625 [Deltaproteobacteria bacterium]|nr:hypothetical protein [Deltaproteobacteria bacterium]